jgi:2-polyprenyl-3-methyl-5-hydroxy-6-metoxy-1,4-benzoquinol methylase
MAGGNTSDVWGRTSDIDESALAVMAARLENRAKHPFFRGVIADYIGALELAPIARVIEIGCGTGVVSRRLAATPGFRGTIIATDMSPYLIEIARQYARAEGVDAHIAFEVSGAASLRAESGACDLVIAHTLLSHAADPIAILAESARVLRPGGQLLIFDRDFAPSALSLDNTIAAKIDVADIARAFARSLSSCGSYPNSLPMRASPSNRIAPTSSPTWATPNSSPRISRPGAVCCRFRPSSPKRMPIVSWMGSRPHRRPALCSGPITSTPTSPGRNLEALRAVQGSIATSLLDLIVPSGLPYVESKLGRKSILREENHDH